MPLLLLLLLSSHQTSFRRRLPSSRDPRTKPKYTLMQIKIRGKYPKQKLSSRDQRTKTKYTLMQIKVRGKYSKQKLTQRKANMCRTRRPPWHAMPGPNRVENQRLKDKIQERWNSHRSASFCTSTMPRYDASVVRFPLTRPVQISNRPLTHQAADSVAQPLDTVGDRKSKANNIQIIATQTDGPTDRRIRTHEGLGAMMFVGETTNVIFYPAHCALTGQPSRSC